MCMEMCKKTGACPVPAGENVDCNCFACSGFDKDACPVLAGENVDCNCFACS